MASGAIKGGVTELRAWRRQSRFLYWIVALFSFFVSLLTLAGPIYMLQVYDRVLSSRSQETLVALSLLVLFLYLIMGLLDGVRARITTRIAERFQLAAQARVFAATIRQSRQNPSAVSGVSHLDAICRGLGSPIMNAVFDLPWTPIFFLVIFVFHPLLGMLAVAGAATLIMLTLANQVLSAHNQADANSNTLAASSALSQWQAEAETVQALSLHEAAFAKWKRMRAIALAYHLRAADVGSCLSASTRTLRYILQSAMLGFGAWLVMAEQMTAGGMIAGSILLGRALTPIETLMTQWPLVQHALRGWRDLSQLLAQTPREAARITLPTPTAELEVKGVTVLSPGDRQAVLRGLEFTLAPGQAVGVIGPSGSGKSSLARLLTGFWPAATGTVRLGGAALDQYASDMLGQHVGYLPQRLQLFEGSIADNIACLEEDFDEQKVITAAKDAGAHEMILELPEGYDTVITGGEARLSGGQMQRLGLARALYRDPVLVILDEPNSNLDGAGSAALNHAIRALKSRRKAVLIMAHRPAAIQECDFLLMLDAGKQVAFGPTQEVMQRMVKNADAIQVSSGRSVGAA